MEGLSPLRRRVAGIDVHRMLHVVTVLIEQPDGSVAKHSREFGGFKRDCQALAAWLADLQVQLVVMESTGIYWKSVYAHLENVGITAWVVNAHFIEHVPGRKTDMLDSEWLAVLARFGLVRGSFIPPKDLRELRLVSRYRCKLSALCSSQINRLHKMLDDAGIKLGAAVSDIHGVSARAMVRGLIEGRSQTVLLSHARGALKRKTEELAASLDGDLSERHLFVLCRLSDSIDALQRQQADIDAYVMRAMKPYACVHHLLQTTRVQHFRHANTRFHWDHDVKRRPQDGGHIGRGGHRQIQAGEQGLLVGGDFGQAADGFAAGRLDDLLMNAAQLLQPPRRRAFALGRTQPHDPVQEWILNFAWPTTEQGGMMFSG